jgi:putative nucleotidyltransferase with HDIG domain
MATQIELLWIKRWFELYIKEFCTGIEHIDSAICLKVHHSRNVAHEILDIANSLNISSEDRCLAEICAILHDIGRFEQFRRYHTYSDSKSENHAVIGIDVIKKTGVLNSFTQADRALIIAVIINHNRATLPESDDSRFLLILKLLRDADKVDIFRVVTEHYHNVSSNNVVAIGLPDTPSISDAVLNRLIDGKNAFVEDLKTLNDFKLLQIGWLFDINFPHTFAIINKRNYLDKINAVLPQIEQVQKIVSSARKHIQRNCA